jgi:hypothetical protein
MHRRVCTVCTRRTRCAEAKRERRILRSGDKEAERAGPQFLEELHGLRGDSFPYQMMSTSRRRGRDSPIQEDDSLRAHGYSLDVDGDRSIVTPDC